MWPQALLPVAADLFWVHKGGTPHAQLQDVEHLQPYAHLMAVVVVAARLCYQLDGSGTVHVPGLPPPPDWQAWAMQALAGLRRQSNFPIAAAEVAFLPLAL